MKNATKPTVHGVGINDSDYKITRCDENGKIVWRCPFYEVWVSMLNRCYSDKYHLKKPTYKGCSVIDEWLHFMAFRAWMITQPWKGNALDKDLKVIGNKVYSHDTCIFVPVSVNSFTTDHGNQRGKYPIGVYKKGNRYASQINNITGKRIHLGMFSTPEEAHEAWRLKKIELAVKLQSQQDRQEVKHGIANYIIHILQTNYYLEEWRLNQT